MSYRTGDSLAHRLDPRTKLAFQVGFALAAFAHTTPTGLAALTVLLAAALAAGRCSPLRALWAYRYALPLLAIAPLLAGVTAGSPWFDAGDAAATALASYRVLLVLLVSAVYVETTTPRESRAAVQRTIPGRAGALAGIGVSLIFRLLPALSADVARQREAIAARLGDRRPVRERVTTLGIRTVLLGLDRAERLTTAMRARCLSYEPTLPPLALGWRDVPVFVVTVVLVLSPRLTGSGHLPAIPP